MSIVERIKQKCKEKETNISALEKELNIGNGVVRRWDERKPLAEQVYKIAMRLNTSVEWILTGKEAAELSSEEQELVECYRAANDQGKRTMLALAQLQKQEQESSTSKIG